MTKHEFINELQKELSTANIKTREEILADINEHFYEGAAQGRSEEEICISLGQPGSIARQVLEEINQQPQTAPPESSWHQPQNANNNNDSDNWNSHSGDFDETFTGVQKINAYLEIGNLYFLPSTDSNFRVMLKGIGSRDKYSVGNHAGELSIKIKRPFKWFQFVTPFGSKTEAIVYVPAQFPGLIKADGICGNIKAENISGDLKLSAAAGNITIDNHYANNVKAESAAGNVKIRLLNNFAEVVKLEASAGNVDFEVAETGQLKAVASAGNVNIRVQKLAGETKIESAAGNVKLNTTSIQGNVKLESSAGNVTLTATDIQGNIRMASAVGSIKAHMPADANCRIDATKPTMGSLKNQITGNPSSPHTLKARAEIGSIKLLAL
ncbi:MAG: DUF4097 family beta strand repeat-containing protein [Defluviitaleaceae bacterium]|nr:DUF4097 family beta strand repeat-containing protein [Defluviitaleaceae bacterium]